MKNCNPVSTPTEMGLKLARDPGGRKSDNTLYKQIAGSLLYLTATRPDIKHVGKRSDLFGFTDSDYAGDPDDRKSTPRYVFVMGSGAISWSSKKQSIVTLSSTEAGFVAATCACQAIWLWNILEELHFKQEEPTPIYRDSSSAIKLCKNPVLPGRSKHIDVKYHLQDLTKDGTIDLIFCRSEDQVATIFTKPLKLAAFQKL
ncbi:hypothetical protein SCA6_010972 [Theobroma cacao]